MGAFSAIGFLAKKESKKEVEKLNILKVIT